MLQRHVGSGHLIHAQATEGDSRDDTPHRIIKMSREFGTLTRLVTANTGKPQLGSVEHPIRLAVMSEVLDTAFRAIADGPEYDVIVHVESDLIWDPMTIGALVDIAAERRHGIDIIAPMIFAGANFYDVWAFRYKGGRFGPFPPFCHAINGLPYLELDSVGSCLAMRWEVIQRVRGCRDEALVGWCRHARMVGFNIAVATQLAVRHPA